MGKLAKKLNLEAAKVDAKISRGDLADLMKKKLTERLEKDLQANRDSLQRLFDMDLPIPKIYRKLLKSIQALSPDTKMTLRITNVRHHNGQEVYLSFRDFRFGQGRHDGNQFLEVLSREQLLHSGKDFEPILRLADEIWHMIKLVDGTRKKVAKTQDGHFRNRVTEYSLESSPEGREILADMNHEIDNLLGV